MLTITRLYEFEAAHHLPDHDGKCRNPHGHSYKLEVSVRANWNSPKFLDERAEDSVVVGSGPKRGMLIDFSDLDRILKPIITALDHHDLNEMSMALDPPTAENIAHYIWRGAIELLREDGAAVELNRIRLYETSKSYVEIDTRA